MKLCKWIMPLGMVVGILVPEISHAGMVEDMQSALDRAYMQMVPMSGDLIDVGRGLAGFAALWYIAARVWRHLANAEPVDFYPLLRPFAIGLAILLFNGLLGVLNGVLKPTVSGTAAMVGDSRKAIERLMEGKQRELFEPDVEAGMESSPDPDKWYKYTHPDGSQAAPGNADTYKPANPIANASFGFGIRNFFRKGIAWLLYVFYQAAALCINTIRIFKLIVLAILGPIVLGLSVFDGFQHTLKHWLARYVNVYLWLPIANIFAAILSKIQENMIAADLAGTTDGSTNTAYLIFLLLGITGFFTIPSIANYIIHAGGHALLRKSSALASTATSAFSTMAVQQTLINNVAGAAIHKAGNPSSGGGSQSGNYMSDKLSGK